MTTNSKLSYYVAQTTSRVAGFISHLPLVPADSVEVRDGLVEFIGVFLDYASIISELRLERERVEEAIRALETLARGSGQQKRRGRPLKWIVQLRQVSPELPQKAIVMSASN